MAKAKSSILGDISFSSKLTVLILFFILFSMPIALVGVMSGVIKFPSASNVERIYYSYNILENSSFENLDQSGRPTDWDFINFKGSDGVFDSPEPYDYDAFGNPISGIYALNFKTSNSAKSVSQEVEGLDVPAGYSFNLVGWFKVINQENVDLYVEQTLHYSDGTEKTETSLVETLYYDASDRGYEIKGRPETIWFQKGFSSIRAEKQVSGYSITITGSGTAGEVNLNNLSVDVSTSYFLN